MKILLATSNKRKIAEMTAITQAEKNILWEFSPLPAISIPEEPYTSFIENACHKAKYYGDSLNVAALSEDTGLCITALNQFPGVRTKEFIEENRTINKAIDVLQQKLKNTSDKSATFVCAAALYIPALSIRLHSEAKEPGSLAFPTRGEDGFGFDPVFIPKGQHHTLAELGIHFKNQHSHRAMAIKGLLQNLRKIVER
jgi:XTP/dITP diphosphohydrolase